MANQTEEMLVASAPGTIKPQSVALQRKQHQFEYEKLYDKLMYRVIVVSLIGCGALAIAYFVLLAFEPVVAEALFVFLKYYSTLIIGGALGALFARVRA